MERTKRVKSDFTIGESRCGSRECWRIVGREDGGIAFDQEEKKSVKQVSQNQKGRERDRE